MDSNSLVDSLTAHIALYHSSTPSTSPSPPNPRASILRWFSSLTLHQRQSSLTIVDSKFAEILLEMHTKLRKHGHCCFIILPDLPSPDRPSLPSLCFRRSQGLLARVSDSNESERLIYDAVRLFTSGEGEEINSVTVSEEFVGDLDRFFEVMDGVSNGGFLRGEETVSGSDWEELPWLKAKGYYSLEAFVANRLELALRLSWLNCSGGKRRGAKLKEKLTVAGVAANVYWRKRGCLNWWAGLDPGLKKNIFWVVLGKAAKSLTNEIVKAKYSILVGEKCLFGTGSEQLHRYCSTSAKPRTILSFSAADVEFGSLIFPAQSSGKPSVFSYIFYSLLVLQEISSMILAFQHSEHENEELFFSTLDSVHTISDCILRKLRELLMPVSSGSIELELIEGENVKSTLNKPKGKHSGGNQRGKGKSRHKKKLNPLPKSSEAKCGLEKACEDHGFELTHKTTKDLSKADVAGNTLQEHAKHLADGKVQTSGKKSKKRGAKTEALNLVKQVTLGDSELRNTQTTSQFVSVQNVSTTSDGRNEDITNPELPNDVSINSNSLTMNSGVCISVGKPCVKDNEVTQTTQEDFVVGSCIFSSGGDTLDHISEFKTMPNVGPLLEFDNIIGFKEFKHQNSEQSSNLASQPFNSLKLNEAVYSNEKTASFQRQEGGNYNSHGTTSSLGSSSFEWPSIAHVRFPSVNSQYLPATTDRLHLDVGRNWRNHFHQSFVSTRNQTANPPIEGKCSRIMPPILPMSLDWPPMVKSASRLIPSITGNYDSGFIPRLQPSYRQNFKPHGLQVNGTISDEERKYSGEGVDSCDYANMPELADDSEPHWISEEEFEVHAFSGRDYNQYFGGGVMYWNTADHAGTSFSRAPSLSSEDSSWAWHEADLNKAIDDMVGFSSSYSTNGLTSPPAGPFCSPFDPLGPGQQALGYVMQGNDVTGKVLHPSSVQTDGVPEESVSGSLSSSSGGVVEVQNGDSFSHPILRPIVIPDMSRKGSRSEFKPSHDRKTPCLPLSGREQSRIKRPPSPVVLCVPRAPCPPPPSPVGESRRRRGFPTVRSGSSSPRHWGMRSWFHDGTNCEEAGVCLDGAEVVWPSWRNKGLAVTPMIQPLPGTLLQDRLIAISQLALDQEHPDVALPLQPPELLSCPVRKIPLSLMHSLLHDEIDSFCKQVAAENLIRKPYINWAVKRVARSLQVLWPRSRTNIFGSNATGLSLPTSDVDMVVCLPPVRNLEPIKEAGILEGRNGIKETCIQHAARYLANQEWVKNDSLKTVENTAIPIIMLVAEVPRDLIISSGNTSNEQIPKLELTQVTDEECSQNSSRKKCSQMKNDKGMDVKSVRLDISFKSPSHTGLQTTELVRELTEQFPAATPLALVLKQFLADRSLDHSYSGGLSSYCLILLITRLLQHEHHFGRSINQNLGSLLMDFLYFFGNVFDPRQMRISIQGSGVYLNRERGHSIDPIHIDDPLFPTNNVGRNCFRIHQCIKAFADAYSTLESELALLPGNADPSARQSYRLLPKIIPSLDHM